MNATLLEEPSIEVEDSVGAVERSSDPVLNATGRSAAKTFSREDLAERENKISSTLEHILRYPIAARHWGINE